MKSLIFFVVSIFFVPVYASFLNAPPSFPHQNSKAIFVDFTHAEHDITYDFSKKSVVVESIIRFSAAEDGYPIFDLVANPSAVILDGSPVSSPLTNDPSYSTSLRVLSDLVIPGDHELIVKHSFATNVIFSEEGVASGFWFSDLNDRQYLELYLPSNLEFDQYPKKLNLNFVGFGKLTHTIKSNGKITKLSDERFEIKFPDYYTSSSIYFHLFPKNTNFSSGMFYYTSIDGRSIPVDIYTSVTIQPFLDLTPTLLAELENDYGPFPHDKIIIYGMSLAKGGMEYAGSTVTGLLSLGHELFHSYNARGILPANGNSGWMDEAMARWRDNGYLQNVAIPQISGRLAGRSLWTRQTDRNSYGEGSAFLANIAYRMNDNGLSLKKFLRDYFKKYMYSTVTTTIFENELRNFSGIDFSSDFNRYIYGSSSLMKSGTNLKTDLVDSHHPNWTKEDLLLLTKPF